MTALERASQDTWTVTEDQIAQRDTVEQATRLAYTKSYILGCTLSLLIHGYDIQSTALRIGRTPTSVRNYTRTLRAALVSLIDSTF